MDSAVSKAASKRVHTVSVRELVEFVLRRGDLGGERQFAGSDRAMAGIRGHQMIQRSRPAGYQKEIPVERRVDAGEFILHIRGRIDGLLATGPVVLLEEIKTVQGHWENAADPLHWAQAKFYAFIYARERALPKIEIQLVYLQLESQQVTEFREAFSFAELSDFFNATVAIYLEWLREQHHWEQDRDQSIRALPFPFPAYRPGQRDLAVAAYRVLGSGGRLFLSAPTGIGKTISILFPAIKALGEGKLEHIFYLTARTIGRAVAEKAVADLRQCGLKLRSVTLTAKEKVCVRAGQPCDLLTCPMALGFYDRIKPALREVLGLQEMNRSALEAVAQKHQVCPFELSLEAAVWADLVICDYNYVFDPQVYLRRFFSEEKGNYAFLVDEAHNLVDRAREMFSAELDGKELLDVKRAISRSVPRCARALAKLHAALRQFGDPGATDIEAPDPSDAAAELNLFPAPKPAVKIGIGDVRAIRDSPESLKPFLALLDAALIAAESWLVQNQPADFRDQLLTFYFQMRSFRRTAGLYDERYITIIENGPAVKMRLFCLDPSHLLRQALARGKAAILFSATLSPIDYFCAVLGGAPEDPRMQLASPFPPANLAVIIHDRIQTQFKARAESLEDVAAAIQTLVQGRAGNYIVYFPSYQYLKAVLERFQVNCPSVTVLVQRPGMTESERDSFLAAFSIDHGTTLAGFAVLGGIFGEGIDLVGERLIGAVIVGVGLPQLCLERDLIRDYFQQQNVPGFDYAYTYPGMNRVLQSVGRVIRSEIDSGVVLLIDTRFNEPRYRRLFPPWWKYIRVRHASALRDAVEGFWNGRDIVRSCDT
jgi:DNA excision repair protein ERCC-2